MNLRTFGIIGIAIVATVCCVLEARAAVYPETSYQEFARVRYFDAHNHLAGVLPYYAYANLPAYVAGFSDPTQKVSLTDKLELFNYLANTWYPADGVALGDKLFSPADGQRFALGARAALAVYKDRVAGSPIDIDGALERVLSATPWTEFDSAYAFRGGPVAEYERTKIYAGDAARMSADHCKATVLDIAATNLQISEQSLSFVHGWNLKDGHSDKLDTIQCVLGAANDASIAASLKAMGKSMPLIKIVLMTHTAELAAQSGGAQYSEWAKDGSCRPVDFPQYLTTTPDMIYNALLGKGDDGSALIAPDQLSAFEDTVIGIDTAGPETTCFTPDGMANYGKLVEAVYNAAKARRAAGWHGKLLVHTHVGEGAAIDFAPSPPPLPWTFASVFATLPSVRSDPSQAHDNIGTLLSAIRAFEAAHPDTKDLLVFRLAHDTWASDDEAQAMHDLGVEADVSLESNVATGAYPIARMPIGAAAILTEDVDPVVSNPDTNLQLNDLLGSVVRDPTNRAQVGAILGAASLKFLLERHVRCLLGTDAAGVEHSDIAKEYDYAYALIGFWNDTDPDFHALAAGIPESALFDNVRWHLKSMSTDAAQPY
ncbi:MAG TPA: hypothetical protein VK760_07660 [Candidatus Acidoferrales bacterium]|jgi:hypothetical protein|nr:hypothetical protein [Candidatus Acidoferrales bacterium]